jgi:hypothetical protein
VDCVNSGKAGLAGSGAGEFLGLELGVRDLTGGDNLAVAIGLSDFAFPPATASLAALRLVSGGGFVCLGGTSTNSIGIGSERLRLCSGAKA